MEIIAKSLPLYYFHRALTETILEQNPTQAIVPVTILIVFGSISLVLAIWVTDWKDL